MSKLDLITNQSTFMYNSFRVMEGSKATSNSSAVCLWIQHFQSHFVYADHSKWAFCLYNLIINKVKENPKIRIIHEEVVNNILSKTCLVCKRLRVLATTFWPLRLKIFSSNLNSLNFSFYFSFCTYIYLYNFKLNFFSFEQFSMDFQSTFFTSQKTCIF